MTTIAAPVTYLRDFVNRKDEAFKELWEGLDWVRHADAPRFEYYCRDCGGSGQKVIPCHVCCNNPLPTGECCGNAVEGQEIQDCPSCYGTGQML
jgi:hypothetical protein